MASRTVEFWLGYGSTYSYLSVMRAEEATRAAGVRLVWKPFNLTTIMRANGFPKGPFVERPDKLAYMWRDLERRAARQGLAYRQPSIYPVDSQLTVRVGCLAAREGWCGAFSRRVFEMNFAQGQAIGAPGTLEAALADVGKDADATIRRAHEPDIEEALARDTETATRSGIFGSPNFMVDGELFWGDDRLEDAIQWSLSGKLSPAA